MREEETEDVVSLMKLAVAMTVMFVLGFMVASAVDIESCDMDGAFKTFGKAYECRVKP